MPSKRDIENKVLKDEIKQIFEGNKEWYGSIRISKVLKKELILIESV